MALQIVKPIWRSCANGCENHFAVPPTLRLHSLFNYDECEGGDMREGSLMGLILHSGALKTYSQFPYKLIQK